MREKSRRMLCATEHAKLFRLSLVINIARATVLSCNAALYSTGWCEERKYHFYTVCYKTSYHIIFFSYIYCL